MLIKMIVMEEKLINQCSRDRGIRETIGGVDEREGEIDNPVN